MTFADFEQAIADGHSNPDELCRAAWTRIPAAASTGSGYPRVHGHDGDRGLDRNEVAIANAITELPEVFKKELINWLFTAYENSPTELRSNIELVAPLLGRCSPRT
jgi:hypothetical protein